MTADEIRALFRQVNEPLDCTFQCQSNTDNKCTANAGAQYFPEWCSNLKGITKQLCALNKLNFLVRSRGHTQ